MPGVLALPSVASLIRHSPFLEGGISSTSASITLVALWRDGLFTPIVLIQNGLSNDLSHAQMRRFKGEWLFGVVWLGYVCGDF